MTDIEWGPEITFLYGTALREPDGHVWDHHADSDEPLTDEQLAAENAEHKTDMGDSYDGSTIVRVRLPRQGFQVEKIPEPAPEEVPVSSEHWKDPECCIWVSDTDHFDGNRQPHGRGLKTRGHLEHRPRNREQYLIETRAAQS